MFKFSVIMSIYNVDKYINEAVKSIVKQKLSFKDNIELIFVDDGSTDSSAKLCKKWQDKYPNNIRYVYKENGGLSSARNTGLQYATGEWVTFIDPDDFINPIYFKKILEKHNKLPDADILIGKLLFYFEDRKKNRRVSDTHPLKNQINRYHNKDIYVDFSDSACDFKQLSVASSFYKKEIISRNNLTFDEKIRPSFEDAHFIARYIYYSSKKAVVSTNSLYFYRKRQNKSSLIDNSWNNPKKYKDQLEFGYLNILNFYKENEKIIPKWIQCVVLYDLSWYFNILRVSNNFIKENTLFLTFLDLCKKIFSNIDQNLISNHRDKVIHSGIDLGILNLFYNKKTFHRHININKYDFEKKYIRAYIFSSSKDLSLEFFIKDKKLNIRTYKVKSINLHDIDFYYKHIFYIDISDVNIDVKSNITTKINQINIDLAWYTNWEKVSPNLQSIKTRFTPIAPKIKFIKLFKPKYLISYLSQLSYFKNKYKNSWILMDRDTNADDNAEHFYRYLKNNTEQNIYFVIRKNTKDFCRLKKEGFKVIPFGSLSHKLALLNCSYVISSHSEKYIHSFLKPKRFKNYIKYKFVFLQHGITKEDMSKRFNSEPIDVLITSTEKEYHSIALNNKYELSKEEVILTGFPRHDSLLKKEVSNRKKTIVIMPTWRAYLTGKVKKNSNFRKFKKESLESLFVKKWFNFLSSEELKKVKEKNNLDIVFYPHLNMEAYTNHFKQIEGITYYDSSDELSIQDLFAKSDIFITDYSSVAFETAYLLKNILYYQFDTEEIFSGKQGRASGYFDYNQDGFGNVCVEEDKLIQSIQKIINNKFIVEEEYLNRMKNEFIYRDGKCSERVYNYLTNKGDISE